MQWWNLSLEVRIFVVIEKLAVVGASGAVGQIVRQLLAERQFPARSFKFLASARSAGSTIEFQNAAHTIEQLRPEAFDDVDLCIASTPDDVAREFIPEAVQRGAVVIDESGAWRMDEHVPLVVPEVNGEAALAHQGIIASPNCSTTQMVVAMKPLHDAARIRRVVVSTYQATSGAGVAGERELSGGHARGAGRGLVRAFCVRSFDRLQFDSPDRLVETCRLHIRRNEDGLRDPQNFWG